MTQTIDEVSVQIRKNLQQHALRIAPVLGGLATLGFPPFDLKFLPLLSFALLFAAVAGDSWKRAAKIGWLFGFAHYASGTYWVYISTHVYGGAPLWLGLLLAILLFAYMACYPALALGLAARLRLFESAWGYAAVPALWLLSELLRGWVFTGFPWLALGYAALDTPLQKFAPLCGVYGLSTLMVLMSYALYRAVRERGGARLLPALLLPAPVLIALLLPRSDSWTADSGAPIRAAILQPAVPQDQKWLPQTQLPMLIQIRDMTLAALDAELVVWPEVAVSQLYDELEDNLLAVLAKRAGERGSTVLAGIVIEEAGHGGYHNSVVALGANGGRYYKRHLVPFGEFFPIPDWLRPMMDVLGTPYSDFLFGEEQQPPVTVAGQRLGLNICFEDVFGSEFARHARGTHLLVNVTNDAWFARSGAAEQHLQIARMRALETGRVYLRASNTGRSAVIGPDGKLQAHTGFFTVETLRATVQPRSGETPYMHWRNAPLWLLGLLIAGAAIRGRRATGEVAHAAH